MHILYKICINLLITEVYVVRNEKIQSVFSTFSSDMMGMQHLISEQPLIFIKATNVKRNTPCCHPAYFFIVSHLVL